MDSRQLIFDGHNDVLLRLWWETPVAGDPVTDFMEGRRQGHFDLPRARSGGFSGGLCAIYVPSQDPPGKKRNGEMPGSRSAEATVERRRALDISLEMASTAIRIERAGGWRLCRSTKEIEEAQGAGIFAAVLHMEGCEAIGPDLAELDLFHAAGLRSLGPLWSRNNIFGHGVPFAFPSSPDIGPGLTDLGRALVCACDRLGILVDTSHMTERGFWDVAEILEQGPLVASHSNANAISPAARNLTDRQLDAIRERRGLVGLNFAVSMLREDGRHDPHTPLSQMVRHIDHLVDRMGIDCVALGSDFDGTTIPAEIGSAAGLPRLVSALEEAGYRGPDLDKICRANWLRVLGQAWREG